MKHFFVAVSLFIGAAAHCYAQALPASTILLSERGIVVTVEDVAQYINFNLKPDARISGLEKERAIKQIVENLYLLRRLHQEAIAAGVPEQTQLDWVAQYESIRFAAVKYMARAETMATERTIEDWETLAREYYSANLESYNTGERRKLSHILIGFESVSYSEWVAKVAQVSQQLDANVPFDKVAAEFSDDEASARLGGSLGIVSRGQMLPNFEQSAFSLVNVGDISEPVFTRYGLHIIQLNEILPNETQDFEAVKPQIKPLVISSVPNTAKEALLLPLKAEISAAIRALEEGPVVNAVKPLLSSN